MLKKFAVLLVTFFLFCSTAFAAETPSDWAKEPVERAISAGIVPPELRNSYTQNITREDFCYLAVYNIVDYFGGDLDFMLLRRGVSKKNMPFKDTNNSWVGYAYSMGIINGVSETEFLPNAGITRQESAVIIKNALEFCGFDTSDFSRHNFSDDGLIADWSKDSIDYIFSKGIMTGTGDNNFSPRTNYTRQQAIITFLNMKNYFDSSTVGKNVSVGENIVSLGDSEYYLQVALKNLKDRYDGGSDGKYYVYYTDYSDLLIVKVNSDKKVSKIATNASRFFYDGKIKTGYIPTNEDRSRYGNIFIMDGESLDGIVISSPKENTQNIKMAELENNLFHFTNAFRVKHGSFTLRYSKPLQEAARWHSEDMANSGNFSHISSDGRELSDRINEVRYNYARVSENIAYGTENEFRAYEGFINSSGHRKNLLENYTEAGMGVHISPSGIPYFTQNFGLPQNSYDVY